MGSPAFDRSPSKTQADQKLENEPFRTTCPKKKKKTVDSTPYMLQNYQNKQLIDN